jgi:MerR family mercuric resistance operon transcriptional regulator
MTQNSSAGVKIGRLAAETGVHLETIRYYQRLGLMPTPQRAHGAVRRYGEDAARRLRFIKRAQALGFSLDEVSLLLDLASGMHCAQTRTLAQRKLKLVQGKILDLYSIEQALKKLIRACNAGTRSRGCPIIENLSEH